MPSLPEHQIGYKEVRDNPYLALKILLDSPPKPDAMTEPVAFNNVKVARQRMRNFLDEMLILKASPPELLRLDADGSVQIAECVNCGE